LLHAYPTFQPKELRVIILDPTYSLSTEQTVVTNSGNYRYRQYLSFPANSDEELTAALGKFLPAIILKLSSPKAEVRKKILEMLVHVNKRVKGNDNVLLPLDALLVQYQVKLYV